MKVIITDIDGVVLNWEERFHEWMSTLGHQRVAGYEELYGMHKIYDLPNVLDLVRQFNSSAAIGYLDSFRDSGQFLHKLQQQGYTFIGVTAMGTDIYAQQARHSNLDRLFPDMFTEVHFVDLHASKESILRELANKYHGAAWVEDLPTNAIAGAMLGMTTFLMDHPYNHDFANPPSIARVQNWEEIYKILV